MYSSLTTFDEKLDDKTLLTELIDYIQLYRRHSLYIATTTFHRAASRYLQSQLNRFEATHTNLLAETSQTHPIIHDSTTHHPQPFTSSTVMLTKGSVEFSGMGLMAKPKGRGLVTSGSKGSLFSLALLRDNSMLELGENLGAEVQEEMLGLLPDGHWWRGCVFHFKDSDVEAIMDQLVSSGLLDGSVPDVMYVCAARVFHHPLGMSSVWVGVGYISDINAKEHLKV
ncbi:hypothetical protein BC829DRAFT_261345 [Chytridium lagenaria]|nr:hypothetical protein BC829DRAFT_261345 [Chytridium lagenaria]